MTHNLALSKRPLLSTTMSLHLPRSNPRFHETHGNDIKIHHDSTTASRVDTKNNGLIFTSRSVRPNEKITIRLTEVSDKLPAIISIGFTSHDPATLRRDLPKSTKSELKRKAGFWICSLSKEYCVKKNVLFFYVTTSGRIRYGVDDDEKGEFERNVDTGKRLWALVDIWSASTTVQIIKASNRSLILHQTCGRNVRLNQNTVRKLNPQLAFNYAFTSRPLKLNQEIVLKMLTGGNLSLGITSCDPDGLSAISLPENPENLLDRPEYWVVINDSTWNLEANDEISYLVTENGEMKIWKNSSLLLKVVHVDHTLELWGFFSLGTVEALEVAVPEISEGHESPENAQKGNSDCLVCCETGIEAALYPCGHMCMCFKCARQQWRGTGDGLCPMCRSPIKDILKIYKP